MCSCFKITVMYHPRFSMFIVVSNREKATNSMNLILQFQGITFKKEKIKPNSSKSLENVCGFLLEIIKIVSLVVKQTKHGKSTLYCTSVTVYTAQPERSAN